MQFPIHARYGYCPECCLALEPAISNGTRFAQYSGVDFDRIYSGYGPSIAISRADIHTEYLACPNHERVLHFIQCPFCGGPNGVTRHHRCKHCFGIGSDFICGKRLLPDLLPRLPKIGWRYLAEAYAKGLDVYKLCKRHGIHLGGDLISTMNSIQFRLSPEPVASMHILSRLPGDEKRKIILELTDAVKAAACETLFRSLGTVIVKARRYYPVPIPNAQSANRHVARFSEDGSVSPEFRRACLTLETIAEECRIFLSR